MQINTLHIPKDGLKLDTAIFAEELDINSDIITFLSPMQMKGIITKNVNVVKLQLKINGKQQIECSRCLEIQEIEFNQIMTIYQQISKDNPILELDPLIREEILLNININPICAQDCKGICPACGKNKNIESCICNDIHVRFIPRT